MMIFISDIFFNYFILYIPVNNKKNLAMFNFCCFNFNQLHLNLMASIVMCLQN